MKTTAEYHINRCLLETYESSNIATFPCMLMPVAMLDSPHDFAFMVTPLYVTNHLPRNQARTNYTIKMECLSGSREVRYCWPGSIVHQMPFDGARHVDAQNAF